MRRAVRQALDCVGSGFLGFALFVDIDDLRDEVNRLAFFVADHAGMQLDPDRPSVGTDVALVHRVRVDLTASE